MAATIQLSVPATLRYRDVAVRIVAEAARLVSRSVQRAPNDLLDRDVRDPFDTAVVSAFAEIFNNVVIHAYARKGGGMIPYRIDERMNFVNPLKLREYLSAGLPVVSTPVPEVARHSHLAHVATTKDEFVAAIRRALAKVQGGALGEVVAVDILRGSEYPPYEGGPVPPWYRDAGYPFRDIGVHCLYLIQELLGPIEDVGAAWRSLGGDPNLAFDEWRALVRCRRGLGQFQLTYNTRPMQSQLIVHGTKACCGSICSRCFTRAAPRCRCPNPPSGSRARSPSRCNRWSRCRSASRGSQRSRCRPTRACAT
jgi:hypothetical protein